MQAGNIVIKRNIAQTSCVRTVHIGSIRRTSDIYFDLLVPEKRIPEIREPLRKCLPAIQKTLLQLVQDIRADFLEFIALFTKCFLGGLDDLRDCVFDIVKGIKNTLDDTIDQFQTG